MQTNLTSLFESYIITFIAVKWEVKPIFTDEREARINGIDRLTKFEQLSETTTVVVKEVTVKKDFNAVLNAKVGDYVPNKDK